MQFELDLAPALRGPGRRPASFIRAARRNLRPSSTPVVRRLRPRDLPLVLPEIGRLAAGGRWITWLAPPVVPTPVACRRYRIAQPRQRLVFPETRSSVDWQRWLERALVTGTSDLVLAWPDPDVRLDVGHLEGLARESRCSLYLFASAPAPGFA